MSQSPPGLMKMSELRRLSGLSRQTLQHYLLLGLITEEGRTPSGRCLFGPAVMDRLALIERLKRERTLGEIREDLGGTARAGGAAHGRAGRRGAGR